jgi:hypothetical protein
MSLSRIEKLFPHSDLHNALKNFIHEDIHPVNTSVLYSVLTGRQTNKTFLNPGMFTY